GIPAWESWWRRCRDRSYLALAPHKLRIQRPGLGDVIGSLDDRAAVGEDGEFVALRGEPKHERVVPNLAQRRQSLRHLHEVQRLIAARGHLHGVAPAERCRVRTELALQPIELAPAA